MLPLLFSFLRIKDRSEARSAPGQVSCGSRCHHHADAASHGPQVDVEPRAASALGCIPRADGAPALCRALRIPPCQRRGNHILVWDVRDETGEVGRGRAGAGQPVVFGKDRGLQRGPWTRRGTCRGRARRQWDSELTAGQGTDIREGETWLFILPPPLPTLLNVTFPRL